MLSTLSLLAALGSTSAEASALDAGLRLPRPRHDAGEKFPAARVPGFFVCRPGSPFVIPGPRSGTRDPAAIKSLIARRPSSFRPRS